jgi:uncharacterized membrane protein
MIETQNPSVVSFLGYLLLLGSGVLFIAWRKDWRILNYIGFAATSLLTLKAVDAGFSPERFWEFMPFLIGFFHSLLHRYLSLSPSQQAKSNAPRITLSFFEC